MGFLKNIFSQDNGNPSSMRVLTAFVVISVISVWGYISIITKTLAPFPAEGAVAIIGALGAKAWQKGKETDGQS